MRDRTALLLIIVSFALAGLSASAAIISFLKEGLGPNTAAWVQAGGSIATVAGAVWIYRSEARLRRRERRAVGEEVAWGVRFALTNAQLEARTIAAELIDKDVLKQGSQRRHWLLRSENCQSVLKVFAERTDHLHPALNHVASNGRLILQQMDQDIATASDAIERGERPSIDITSDIARYEQHFARLILMLDERMRGVVAALDEGSDILPTSRFDRWTVEP